MAASSRDTATVARDLFCRAQRSVLISTYAIYQGREVFAILAERMEELADLRVRFFVNISRKYNDTTVSAQLIRAFAQDFRSKHWSGSRLPEVYYDPRSLAIPKMGEKKAVLHAKCIVIDDAEAFISSANFTEAAHERNIEAGVLVREPGLARSLRRQFETLVATEQLLPVPGL